MTRERPNGRDVHNLFSPLPSNIGPESVTELLHRPGIRIERIVSRGHTSPETGWYDQDEHEWVLVLDGAGTIEFEDGDAVKLTRGDYLLIPAHHLHKVVWTDPNQPTLWLAVFFAIPEEPGA